MWRPLGDCLSLAAAVILSACGQSDRLVGTVAEDQLTDSGAGANSGSLSIRDPFGAPQLITELVPTATAAGMEDPTLTSDEREIYFTYSLSGQIDIWSSARSSTSDKWGTAHRVAELSSADSDHSPEISADGLTIYFSSTRPGDPDDSLAHLWQSQRATRTAVWDAPVQTVNPTPDTQDLAPSLDSNGLWLALAAIRDADTYHLYLSHRSSLSDLWTVPVRLDSLNSTRADWDPALFFGATQIMFSSQRNDAGDLYQAERASTADPFSAPVLVKELDTASSEGDPWVSADGHRVYFASNRGGGQRLYLAAR